MIALVIGFDVCELENNHSKKRPKKKTSHSMTQCSISTKNTQIWSHFVICSETPYCWGYSLSANLDAGHCSLFHWEVRPFVISKMGTFPLIRQWRSIRGTRHGTKWCPHQAHWNVMVIARITSPSVLKTIKFWSILHPSTTRWYE